MPEPTKMTQEAGIPKPSNGSNLFRGVSIGLITATVVLLVSFFASDLPAWRWMFRIWMTNPDNSHGLLVPAFALWLLWHRRDLVKDPFPAVSRSATGLGIAFILGGIALRCLGIYTRTISMEAASVIPCVGGLVLFCGGWYAARWAWPAVLFLVFMVPIPGTLGNVLSGSLQTIATLSSTFLLQTAGIPAVSEGNIIWLTDKPLGVAQACSGLRMMTSFFALAAGVAVAIDRPLWEKIVIILSAPVIAISANVLRIFFTAIAYEFGNEKMAELIFHDLAGWLMMPLGLLMLWGELLILAKLVQNDDDQGIRVRRAVPA